MITTDTEFQSVEQLIAELETEIIDLEKLNRSPDVGLAIEQRQQHINNLKTEIAEYVTQ